MDDPVYVDTTLIECNRKTSPQYLAGNDTEPNVWTNDCGDGVKLNVGDQISVHSAYISEIGNESATIEIKGQLASNNLNEGQTYNSSDTTLVKTTNAEDIAGYTSWLYTPTTQTNDIRDDEINLTHSYYKSMNAEYYITLPRTCAWNSQLGFRNAHTIWTQYNGSTNGAVNGHNSYRFDNDYANVKYYGQANGEGGGTGYLPTVTRGTDRLEIANDGTKMTLFVNRHIYNYKNGGDLQGHRDPALFNYKWYKKTHNYKVEKGFNSPNNVAQSITDQMNNVRTLESEQIASATQSDKKNRNYDLVATSRVNEPFPCAFGEGFNSAAADGYLNFRNGDGVGITTSHTTAANIGGDFRNSIELTTRVGVEIGMYLISSTDSSLNTYASERQVIALGGASDPVSSGATTVYMNGNIPNYASGETVVFGFLDREETYDYFYQSCYSTIGYKRPEIQEKGRFLNNNFVRTMDGSWEIGYELTHPISDVANQVPWLVPTTLEWTDDNLLKLKNFFESQKKYPELFQYNDMSTDQMNLMNSSSTTNIDTARWIHLNMTTTGTGMRNTTGPHIVGDTTITLNTTAGLHLGMVLVKQEYDDGGTVVPYDPGSEPFPQIDNTGEIDDHRTYIININGNDVTLSQSARYFLFTGSELTFTSNRIGTDQYYGVPSATTDVGVEAGALFIDFNKNREDINEGFGYDNPVPFETLRYGFAYQYHNSELNASCIGFWTRGPENVPTRGVNGVNAGFFTDAGTTIAGSNRCIGFDLHFNAYGTGAITLYNGLCGKYGNPYGVTKAYDSYMDRTFDDGNPVNSGGTQQVSVYEPAGFNQNYLNNEIYIGADDPILQFNGSQSRFEFLQLHAAEMSGNTMRSGEELEGADTVVYKINKRLNQMNYSPNFIPYNNTENASITKSVLLDRNIVPYSIMDAHGGVFFEDYGCDQRNWVKSLWELLGFSYEQFHQTTDNRLVRQNDLPITTSTPTTNALVRTSDLRTWTRIMNASDVEVLTYAPEKIPYPSWLYEEKAAATNLFPNLRGSQNFIEISQNCSSTTIQAQNLPRKMISPIYLVKSDILATQYIGGQKGTSNMPVVAVVPKDNGYGDFYTGGQGDVFTNTQERTIQNITVDICDADGSASRVDDSCCVVFKIQKELPSNKNIVESILNERKSVPSQS